MPLAGVTLVSFIVITLAVVVHVALAVIVAHHVATDARDAGFQAAADAITIVGSVYTRDLTLVADPVRCTHALATVYTLAMSWS